MTSKFLFGLIVTIIFIFHSFEIEGPNTFENKIEFNNQLGISDVFEILGDQTLQKQMPRLDEKGVSAERGKEIVTLGYTTKPKGGKSRRISKHFVCTSCHNIEREDPDLSAYNPEDRLTYTNEKGIPFLQGTTLFGLINRTSFYNGDYKKKYGDLVDVARNDIREAIQLCSVECSQGRKMKAWEVESVLAYLKTIEIKIADLSLSEEELRILKLAVNNGTNKEQAISLIKSKYQAYSPATFINPPVERNSSSEGGNIASGKIIYDQGCMHCHNNQRYSFFRLDNSPLTFKHLASNFKKYTDHSIYQVSRYGTSPKNGKRAYMPQYTEERMSVQQMEDLSAYILKMAGR